MRYEVKRIDLKAFFMTLLPVLAGVGLVLAVLNFFINPNPTLRVPHWWQKTLATLLFTAVYGLMLSGTLTGIAALYNAVAKRRGGFTVEVDKAE